MAKQMIEYHHFPPSSSFLEIFAYALEGSPEKSRINNSALVV